MLQSRLTTRYLELVHTILIEPVDERLMGELIFNFTMTLPLHPIASLENKKRKKKLEMGAETYVKCSEKSKETVSLLSNLLAIERKNMKDTIEACLKKLFYYLS